MAVFVINGVKHSFYEIVNVGPLLVWLADHLAFTLL